MKAFDYEPLFNKTVLSNGVRVVTEHHPNTRASSAGIYVDLGGRDEPSKMIGAAHFVEHLVFKGTTRRTAFEIACELERVGGEMNAYTTRENTCFHAVSLREHLPLAIDVLCDVVSQAQFDNNDFEKERQVILQEIDMSADLLEEYVFDLFYEHIYKGHPLSRPILGTRDSLMSISRDQLRDFYQKRYHGKHIVVAVAGDVNHQQVVELVEKNLLPRAVDVPKVSRNEALFQQIHEVVSRPSEQVHAIFGFPSCSFCSDHRFDAFIANAVIGGGITSRLYQKVREEHGLVYSIYSFLQSFTDSGTLNIYAGTSKELLPQVIDFVIAELARLRKEGISKEELSLYKEQVAGSILLNADDIENRMNSIAINEMVFSEYRTVDSIIEEIRRTSEDSFREYFATYMKEESFSSLLCGDLNEDEGKKLVK